MEAITKYIYRTYDEGEPVPDLPVPDFVVMVTEDRISLRTINGQPLYDATLEQWAMYTILAVT